MFYLNREIMVKVVLGWSPLTVPQRIIKVRYVVTTTGNNTSTYATPDPPLQDLSDKADELEAAEAAASKGGTNLTVVRNARLDEMTTLMNQFVLYVQTTSLGVAELIVQSGLDVEKERSPWPLPLRVTDLEAAPGGDPGTIALKWGAAKYNKGYIIERWFEDETGKDGKWDFLVNAKRGTHTVTGLTTGKQYRFRVAAENSAGQGDYSDEASSVAR
ncbi:MAG: hypothetical protein ACI85F_001850 [Bacteroidia bacterium]|jgi:hypothetical protein